MVEPIFCVVAAPRILASAGLMLFLIVQPIHLRAEEGFEPLFNGQDLAGWQRVTTDQRTWSVRDGMLICTGKPIGELRTERMYQNFVLELEWRHMVPGGNAGIFVWADAITAKGQPFHRSIEVQVLENDYGNNRSHTTHGDIFPIHGAEMTPINGRGGSRAFPTEFRSRPSPQWNRYRIEAVDGNISLAVNGKVVTRGTDCLPRKGYICIESEGGVVHYRNVRIKVLPDTPVADELVAREDRGYRCLYTGIDLEGWRSNGSDAWLANDWQLKFTGSPGGNAALETEEQFSDFGFIIDVRLSDDSGRPAIALGEGPRRIVLDRDDPQFAAALAGSGKWNRVEGTVDGDSMSLSVNDTEIWSDKKVPAVGTVSLRLEPDGPVDFANIFVRSLP